MLDQDITYLKGVGPSKSQALREELGIATFEDLVLHYPFRYVDKSQLLSVREIQSESISITLQLECVGFQEAGHGPAKRLIGKFRDSTGDLDLVWFKGIKWIKDSVKIGQQYLVYGKPSRFGTKFNLVHPELEVVETSRLMAGSSLKPVYPTTEKLTKKGLNSHGIAQLTRQLMQQIPQGTWMEVLPHALLTKFKLMSREQAIREVHLPTNPQTLEMAKRRLKFEELFFIQIQIIKQKFALTIQERGVVFPKVGEAFNTFYHHHLPFPLTGAQKRVVKEIRQDVAKGFHMNRLIQGDVGSGKTIVALLSMLLAVDNGFQACLMAPTEILAQQHFELIRHLLAPLKMEVVLLTGSTAKSERKVIHAGLKEGHISLLIGTHALIEPVVEFSNLGLVVIDEQHRFGVAQRAALWKKAALPPHVLVMTATPIPRTLAMTLYGDLDVSVIDELPPGRKPVETIWRSENRRGEIFDFLRKQIDLGRQVYVVYPLIEESEALDYLNLNAGYEGLLRSFPRPRYQFSVVHGRMKPEARDQEMQMFINRHTHIMVATTVIEVGVNVPNASVMLIEGAERFGLSQLHQLRGRVGRGADQSYCILMTGDKLSNDSKTRLETMCRTTDGFEIAEVDLQLRGPGDLAGTQQSGALNLKIADLVKDQTVLLAARESALEILSSDAELMKQEHACIRQHLAYLKRDKSDWSRIS